MIKTGAKRKPIYLGDKDEQAAKEYVDKNCIFNNHEQWQEDIKTFR